MTEREENTPQQGKTGGELSSGASTPQVRRRYLLIGLRYLAPVLAAVLLPLLGGFYNVAAVQMGQELRLSLLRLSFTTLKNARLALLAGEALAAGVKSFYVLLAVCAVLALLLYLGALFFAGFALRIVWRAYRARRHDDGEAVREAGIWMTAFLRSRGFLLFTNLMILPLAFFPELFSFLCGRLLGVGLTDAYFVRFNPVALAVSLLLLLALVLSVYTRRFEAALGLDLFSVGGAAEREETEETSENDDGEDDGDDDENDGIVRTVREKEDET